MFEVYHSQSFLSSCQHHTAFPAIQDASSMAKIQVLVLIHFGGVSPSLSLPGNSGTAADCCAVINCLQAW